MHHAQKLRSEAPEGLAPQGPHKKVEAQRRRWTFYEVIKIVNFFTNKPLFQLRDPNSGQKPGRLRASLQ
jgi:hypothetical protein